MNLRAITSWPLFSGFAGCRLIAFLVAMVAAGCELPGRPTAGDRAQRPQEEKAFPVLYQKTCAGCHGDDGNLGPAPPLNDGLFLALVPDAELARVIRDGRPGTLMPAFAASRGGHLTDEQVQILAQGIKPRWHPVDPVPSQAPAYLDDRAQGDRSTDVKRGREAFARACAPCHGERGEGGQVTAAGPGRSAGAINDADFLATISDQALRRFVITGRPDLGMPNFADGQGRAPGFTPLTSRDVADLVAFLVSWRHIPMADGGGK